MAWRVELNRAAVGRILREGAVPAMVNRTAETIADGTRSRMPNDGRGDVVVEPYTTDRGAAAIVVRHPKAIGLQGKYGILTNAARAVGAEVQEGR